jgi:hypothetical protein
VRLVRTLGPARQRHRTSSQYAFLINPGAIQVFRLFAQSNSMVTRFFKRLCAIVALALAATGSAQATVYSYRIQVPGLQPTLAAAPAVPSDPYWNNVTSLVTFDGSLTDLKGGTYTLSNGAALSSTVSDFGSGSVSVVSGYMRGTTAAFGTKDFTVEMFVKGSTNNTTYEIFDTRPTGTNSNTYFTIGQTIPGGISVAINNTYPISSSSYVPVDGAWHHVALSRAAGVTRLFIDGSQVGPSYTDTNNYTATSFGVGWNAFGVTEDGFYVDELRITTGVGRYTGNFTVPTSAFPTQ